MMITLHEIEPHGKTPSVVLRINLHGKVDVQLIANHSGEENALRQRLTMAGPLLETMRGIFAVEPLRDETDVIRS